MENVDTQIRRFRESLVEHARAEALCRLVEAARGPGDNLVRAITGDDEGGAMVPASPRPTLPVLSVRIS